MSVNYSGQSLTYLERESEIDPFIQHRYPHYIGPNNCGNVIHAFRMYVKYYIIIDELKVIFEIYNKFIINIASLHTYCVTNIHTTLAIPDNYIITIV